MVCANAVSGFLNTAQFTRNWLASFLLVRHSRQLVRAVQPIAVGRATVQALSVTNEIPFNVDFFTISLQSAVGGLVAGGAVVGGAVVGAEVCEVGAMLLHLRRWLLCGNATFWQNRHVPSEKQPRPPFLHEASCTAEMPTLWSPMATRDSHEAAAAA